MVATKVDHQNERNKKNVHQTVLEFCDEEHNLLFIAERPACSQVSKVLSLSSLHLNSIQV